ncbi:MAG: anthranilate phosphoribosyltransferase [Chitinophagales bacterium]|nr:anthranilate phosphoribosyltransferase [Chitinophagales bacterium]
MKEILNHLFENKVLTKRQAKEVLISIAKGDCNKSQIAAFLSVYIMRSVTVEELDGFRDALLELCLVADLSEFDTVDVCGTGGDGKNTFNISTLAGFVVAGTGIKVAKHGNYGVSSVSGSSDMMEFFGFTFTNRIDMLKLQIEQAGITFLHAPLFHPAIKMVAPVRKELGVKTFFNMLGPLVNPSFPKYQCTGVFNLTLARLYQYLLQQSQKNFLILHSLQGYDEISLTGSFKMISNEKEEQSVPEQYGFTRYLAQDISGGDSITDAAKIFMGVLNGDCTPAQREVTIANAAFAIHTVKSTVSITDCIAEASESLESKRALHSFSKLLNTTL